MKGELKDLGFRSLTDVDSAYPDGDFGYPSLLYRRYVPCDYGVPNYELVDDLQDSTVPFSGATIGLRVKLQVNGTTVNATVAERGLTHRLAVIVDNWKEEGWKEKEWVDWNKAEPVRVLFCFATSRAMIFIFCVSIFEIRTKNKSVFNL